ncbi:hypothetical protein GQX74_013072 [Glossina fuscipes]|nr:hypothetical protein GQX74_013072 [Glossina fuscipes]
MRGRQSLVIHLHRVFNLSWLSVYNVQRSIQLASQPFSLAPPIADIAAVFVAAVADADADADAFAYLPPLRDTRNFEINLCNATIVSHLEAYRPLLEDAIQFEKGSIFVQVFACMLGNCV